MASLVGFGDKVANTLAAIDVCMGVDLRRPSFATAQMHWLHVAFASRTCCRNENGCAAGLIFT